MKREGSLSNREREAGDESIRAANGRNPSAAMIFGRTRLSRRAANPVRFCPQHRLSNEQIISSAIFRNHPADGPLQPVGAVANHPRGPLDAEILESIELQLPVGTDKGDAIAGKLEVARLLVQFAPLSPAAVYLAPFDVGRRRLLAWRPTALRCWGRRRDRPAELPPPLERFRAGPPSSQQRGD